MDLEYAQHCLEHTETFPFILLITTYNLLPLFFLFFTTLALEDLFPLKLNQCKPGVIPLKSVNFVGIKTEGTYVMNSKYVLHVNFHDDK